MALTKPFRIGDKVTHKTHGKHIVWTVEKTEKKADGRLYVYCHNPVNLNSRDMKPTGHCTCDRGMNFEHVAGV